MAAAQLPNLRSHLTLALATALHTFTHAYATMLVPLYLVIQRDLNLSGVKAAAAIVTVYGVTYCLFSYEAGKIADRHDRRLLLGIGLVGNALAIIAMGFTHQYAVILGLAVVCGLFGTLFHPTANSLIPAHYPKSPGMAIGLLGAGSGLGFYLGPKFAGWRAETAAWDFRHVTQWQKPLVELGIIGLIVGVLFLIFATEATAGSARADLRKTHPPLGAALRRRVLGVAMTLGCRDFAGVASISLIGIYLRKALDMSVGRTGAILGSMMVISIFVNPIAVALSPRRRRLPTLAALLIAGAAMLASVPFVPGRWLILVLGMFQACHLGSYGVSDAAMLERVPGNLRGRVVGLFLGIAGTVAATGPWVMGYATDRLGDRAGSASAYVPIFGATGALMLVAIASVPIIGRLGPVQGVEVDALSETMPATVEVVG